MLIGLIDVDGHHFPNLALMRLSAWHKSQGDNVEWWIGNLFYYDIVYKSKIFSDVYSIDNTDPYNCGKVVQGGTGYAISNLDGKERYDKNNDQALPDYIEDMFPDYSLYPQYSFAVAMTSRGCPRGCSFCHVAAKEGKCAVKVANVKDFWNGQKQIKVLDPNILACKDKRDLLQQYIETGANIDFSQGLDIRLINDNDISDLLKMKLSNVHFAWDDPSCDLTEKFKHYALSGKKNRHGSFGTVYVLTNFNSTMEENLYRIYNLRDLGYDPYVMIYDKPNAPKDIKRLQRWCNSKFIIKKCPRFEDYQP